MHHAPAPCTTRVLPVGVRDAEAGLDHLRRDRRGSLVVTARDGDLVLRGDGRLGRPPLTGYSARRLFQGTLRVGRFGRVPVELELLPWSNDQAELVLRPRPLLGGTMSDRAYGVAVDALRRLSEQISLRGRLAAAA